ncbi:MAG: NUDIX domain-containing protein [Nitrososphaeria archaeon]|nr:NUDIX domain-containing protein [Nitrososphaeria archaeon]NIN51580.1 NUDIX domain-containing protein [Nitrososphaeria archaeon]NIQ32065.1 NUDIX domain-containing protein [Nitrososphaeria archaeon]
MPRERSIGAVIFRREEHPIYLLLHYKSGHWDFVKGNIEKGEREKETVVRETKEEAGIEDLVFLEGFRDKISYFYRRGNSTVYKEVVFFLAETKTEEVELSYEHIGYQWLRYEEAYEKTTYKNSKKVIQKAHQFLTDRQK